MESGTITEAQFLITELQYTLGQLHVQLADLDVATRATMRCGDRSVEDVLHDLGDNEKSMQSQYARLLELEVPDMGDESGSIALPVSDDDVQPSAQSAFEHLRSQTIDMLRGTDDRWNAEVLDLVREHVKNDRTQTTQIAECRKSLFVEDSRPDLEVPLTDTPRPHEFAGQEAPEARSDEENTAAQPER